MNKQLLSILSIVISVVLALGIYLYFAQIEDNNIKPIQIVPENAFVVLEANNSSRHLKNLSDLAFAETLFGNEKIAELYRQLSFYDSLIQGNETIADWFNKGQAIYSFHSFSNKTIGFFMAVQTQKDVEANQVLDFFQKNFPNRFKLSRRKFINDELYDFTDFKDGTHFTIAFKSKLMLFSPDGSLVEMALISIGKHYSEPTVKDRLSFVKNSGDGLNVYFIYANLPGFLRGISNENYPQRFSIPGEFAENSVYNIEIDDENILLKGAAITHETKFQYLDLLNAQAPIPNNLNKLLPDGVHFACTFGFNGYNSFYKNVNEYLLNRNLSANYKNYVDSIEKHLQFSFSDKLASKFGNHAAIIAIDEPGLWKDSCFVTAIESADDSGMDALLNDMERAVKRNQASDTSHIYTDTIINEFPRVYFGDIFKYYFTDLFEGIEARYYIRHQGYYFFANNTRILQVMKLRWEQQKMLNNSPYYKEFENSLSPNSNFEIWLMNDHAPKLALNYLNKDWFSMLNQNMGTVKRFQAVGIQFAGSNDKVFATQMLLHFNVSKVEKTEQIWAIQLDSNLMMKPQVMYNFGLGSHVILAQDAKKQLYMIDREGKILWKQAVDDKIISGISELDLFNNGKRQWLFNTSHMIYLIDENGKNISGWPVWIPTGTNYPVSVFDPLNDHNYQVFATGIFYKISAYNSQARLLPFWNPKEVWPNIKSSVGTFVFGGKQVYWGLNEKGRISFLNNTAKPFDQIKLDSQYVFLDVKIKSVDTGLIQITALDSNQLYVINYYSTKAPEVKTIPVMGYQSFSITDNNPSQVIYLLTASDKLCLMDESGNISLQRTMEHGRKSNPHWTNLGNGLKLIYYDSATTKLCIENAKEEPYSPFPVAINGPYAIGNLFNEADTWLIFSDATNKFNLYRIK